MSHQVRCDWCDAKPPPINPSKVSEFGDDWRTFEVHQSVRLSRHRLDFCNWSCVAAYAERKAGV